MFYKLYALELLSFVYKFRKLCEPNKKIIIIYFYWKLLRKEKNKVKVTNVTLKDR